MVIRHQDKLPNPQEALRLLSSKERLHILGPRREAVLALLAGPFAGFLVSLLLGGALLSMLEPNDPRSFLWGPILGLLGSLGWGLYSLHLLRSPAVETGLHLTDEKLITFALRRKAGYHEIPWGRCEEFLSSGAFLWVKAPELARKEGYIDEDHREEEGIPLHVPSSFLDAAPLASFLTELRRLLERSSKS